MFALFLPRILACYMIRVQIPKSNFLNMRQIVMSARHPRAYDEMPLTSGARLINAYLESCETFKLVSSPSRVTELFKANPNKRVFSQF